MATLNRKIKLYLEDNSKVYLDEKNNYLIQNDGSGDYIKSWNVSGLDKPNDNKIAEYETAGNTLETANVILRNRKIDYPSIADQLDDIYHNGIDAWKVTIKATKDKYPKG